MYTEKNLYAGTSLPTSFVYDLTAYGFYNGIHFSSVRIYEKSENNWKIKIQPQETFKYRSVKGKFSTKLEAITYASKYLD